MEIPSFDIQYHDHQDFASCFVCIKVVWEGNDNSCQVSLPLLVFVRPLLFLLLIERWTLVHSRFCWSFSFHSPKFYLSLSFSLFLSLSCQELFMSRCHPFLLSHPSFSSPPHGLSLFFFDQEMCIQKKGWEIMMIVSDDHPLSCRSAGEWKWMYPSSCPVSCFLWFFISFFLLMSTQLIPFVATKTCQRFVCSSVAQ